jgi:hypothetical protein
MIVSSLRKILRRDVAQVSQSIFSAAGVSPKCLLHTFAISREIPQSFEDALSFHSQISDPISMETSRQQHAVYLENLRRHIPTLCLPALESNPDCVFVEDCAVAVGNRAVVLNLGHLSRRGEADSIKVCCVGMLLLLGGNTADACMLTQLLLWNTFFLSQGHSHSAWHGCYRYAGRF